MDTQFQSTATKSEVSTQSRPDTAALSAEVDDTLHLSFIAESMDLPTVVVVQGYPGVGKETITEKVMELRLIDKAMLVKNHQAIDPAWKKYPGDLPNFYRERQRISNGFLGDFASAVRDSIASTLICTEVHSVPHGDPETQATMPQVKAARRYVDFASSIGARLVVVTLICKEDENIKRVVGRPARGKKITTEDEIRAYLRKTTIYKYKDTAYSNLEIDVTSKSPEEAAHEMVSKLAEAGVVSSLTSSTTT